MNHLSSSLDPLPLQRLGNVGANSLRCEFYLFWNCYVPLFWCRTAQLPSTQLLCWAALALLGLPPFSFRSVASAWTNSCLCGRLSLSAGRIWHKRRRTVQLSHAIRMQDEAACNTLLKQCSTIRAAAMLTKWRPQAAKPTNAFLAAAWQKLTDVSGVSSSSLSLSQFCCCWLTLLAGVGFELQPRYTLHSAPCFARSVLFTKSHEMLS